jgi:hypothetical protein
MDRRQSDADATELSMYPLPTNVPAERPRHRHHPGPAGHVRLGLAATAILAFGVAMDIIADQPNPSSASMMAQTRPSAPNME